MRSFKSAASVALSSLVLVSTAAQAGSNCWHGDEAKAAQLRDLQTMLVVGVMECRAAYPDTLAAYNRFVVQQRSLLVETNALLKARFDREEGADGGSAYDRFHTASANAYAGVWGGADAQRCAHVAALASQAAGMSRAELLALADRLVAPPFSGVCEAPGPVLAAMAVAPAVVPAAAAAPAAVPFVAVPTPVGALADAADTPPVPVAKAAPPAEAPAAVAEAAPPIAPIPAEAPVTVAQADAPPPASAVPAPSREDVLRAAIVALQAATAALQAATAAPSAAAPMPGAIARASTSPPLPLQTVAHEPVVPAEPPAN